MGSISGSGIACAAPTTGSAISRRRIARLALAVSALATLGATAPIGSVTIAVADVRSAKGELRLCLTADPDSFPSCTGDARAITRSVPASQRLLRFDALPQGDWAVAVIHDANDNDRLDTFAGIPREGFGFSNNPPLGFGAPRFAAARFRIGSDASVQQVKMRYLL